MFAVCIQEFSTQIKTVNDLFVPLFNQPSFYFIICHYFLSYQSSFTQFVFTLNKALYTVTGWNRAAFPKSIVALS